MLTHITRLKEQVNVNTKFMINSKKNLVQMVLECARQLNLKELDIKGGKLSQPTHAWKTRPCN